MSRPSKHGLDQQGFVNTGTQHWNLPRPSLVEHALSNGEGTLAVHGPLVVSTGQHTGRSPKDKFVVRESSTEAEIWWG